MDETYTLGELLAETSFARIYRITKGGKDFLLKTPKDGNVVFLDMIRKEYQLSLQLQHPYIASVYEYAEDTPGGPGILMEYSDARSLREFISEKPSIKLRMKVLDQLLDAVSYFHECGIVHNNLDPKDILVTKRGNNVKIIDFGLSAEDVVALGKSGRLDMGYVSPELAANSRKLDRRSDIYSLGKIIDDLFGGKFGKIVDKCTRKKAGKRFENVDQLKAAFEKKNTPWKFFRGLLLAALILTPSYFAIRQRIDMGKTDKTIDSLRNALSESYARLDSLKLLADNELLVRDSLNDLIDRKLDDGVTRASFIIDTTRDWMIAQQAIIDNIQIKWWVDSLCRSFPETLSAMVKYHYEESYAEHWDKLNRAYSAKWGEKQEEKPDTLR
ncbi:MAG: serine/threonine protein kinase [Bacteroidales bacterium]|nr:serine/threonine protein kinase [Bacteroidales bacterium]